MLPRNEVCRLCEFQFPLRLFTLLSLQALLSTANTKKYNFPHTPLIFIVSRMALLDYVLFYTFSPMFEGKLIFTFLKTSTTQFSISCEQI